MGLLIYSSKLPSLFSLLIGDQEIAFWLWNKKSKNDQKAEEKNVKENTLLLMRSKVERSLKKVHLKSRFSKNQGWSKNSARDVEGRQGAGARQVKTITGATAE